MNIIDFALILIVLISTVFAIYRGFLASLLGTLACAVSLVVALAAGPRLSQALAGNQGLTSMLSTYTDAESLIGDYDLANTVVLGIGSETIENILRSVSLPEVVQNVLRQNMQTQAFQDQQLYTINDYVSTTIVTVTLNTLCFLLCYFLCFLALHMLINLISHVFYFPVLRHLEGVCAAVMGVIRGGITVYVLLAILPMVRTVVPFELVTQYIDGSQLIPLLYSEKLVLRILVG